MSVVKAKIQTVEDMYRLILDGGSEQATDQSHLEQVIALGCFALIDSAAIVWANCARALLSVWRRERKRGLGPIGSPENGRCVVFEKLRRVELWNDSWKTAPNHSRPASCVVEADIDAEDQPERDPQKGH